MRFMPLVVALTFGTAGVAAARAQSKMAAGVEAGALHLSDESLFQLGLRVTPSRGGYGSVEFAFATFPDELANGAFVFLMDLGITSGAPSDSSPVYVFPHGGVSLLAGGGAVDTTSVPDCSCERHPVSDSVSTTPTAVSRPTRSRCPASL